MEILLICIIHSRSMYPLLSRRYMSLLFLSFSGFESRQPSHVLMASYPYNPLENRYTFYPHPLRNTGELVAQSEPQ